MDTLNTEVWRSHDKGGKTRTIIFELKRHNPSVSTAELARATGVKPQQVKRQISRLYADGKLKVA